MYKQYHSNNVNLLNIEMCKITLTSNCFLYKKKLSERSRSLYKYNNYDVLINIELLRK